MIVALSEQQFFLFLVDFREDYNIQFTDFLSYATLPLPKRQK